jgi:hypothetical protein
MPTSVILLAWPKPVLLSIAGEVAYERLNLIETGLFLLARAAGLGRRLRSLQRSFAQRAVAPHPQQERSSAGSLRRLG